MGSEEEEDLHSGRNKRRDSDDDLREESEVSVHLAEEEDRRAFRDAFITEIGQNDLTRLITFRELVDVIVCAGKDVTAEDLHGLWTYGSEKEEISYDEAYHIFQQVPVTDFDALYNSFAALSNINGQLDYDKIIAYAEEQASQSNDDLKDVLQMLREKKRQKAEIESIMYDIHSYQTGLKELNSQIVEEQCKLPKTLLLRKSSSESLSSLFSNRNVATCEHATGRKSGSIVSTFREPLGEKTVSLKSLVIQKNLSQSTCVAYSFSLERSQRIKINVEINEKIDSSLSRFHNSILGFVVARDSTKIYSITKRKENAAMCTEWVQLPAGTYTLILKFCRPLKMIEPEKSDEILDSRKRLTKPFKVMLMNLFDMFDLDNDGLLSRAEFEAYSILSGSGKVKEEKWDKIRQKFELRNCCLSMRTFMEMHQFEAESYGPKGILQDMWAAVRELGHNKKFFMSTSCPLTIDFLFSDGTGSFAHFEIEQSLADSEDFLIDYFWENGTQLPYLKEIHSLRQFKTDYYAILLAGKVGQSMHYKLDLSMSSSVNIEGNDLVIDQNVDANTIKILTVAIAVADSWFLSVKSMDQKANEELH